MITFVGDQYGEDGSALQSYFCCRYAGEGLPSRPWGDGGLSVGDGNPMTSWHEDALSIAQIAEVADDCLGCEDRVLCVVVGSTQDQETFVELLRARLARGDGYDAAQRADAPDGAPRR
jgi:hypothetical protein